MARCCYNSKQESRFPSTTLICHATHSNKKNEPKRIRIPRKLLIPKHPIISHDCEWLSSGCNLVCMTHSIRLSLTLSFHPIIRGKTRFPCFYGEWTFYQIPSTIINHQLLRVQLSKGRRETTIFLMVFCYLFSSLGYFTTPCASGTMIYIIRGEAKYGNEALMPYACSMCDSKM